MKKGLSSFLGVITDTLAPPPDKTIDCDVITLVATPAGTTEVYDSSKVGSSASSLVLFHWFPHVQKYILTHRKRCVREVQKTLREHFALNHSCGLSPRRE